MTPDAAPRPAARRLWRAVAKVLHELAAIGFGGGLAACLLINLRADPASPAGFAAARQALLLLIALSVVNVVLAVWRPRLTWRVR